MRVNLLVHTVQLAVSDQSLKGSFANAPLSIDAGVMLKRDMK